MRRIALPGVALRLVWMAPLREAQTAWQPLQGFRRAAMATVRMLLIVDGPDAVSSRAVAAGASTVSPMAKQHGWRVGRIVDPFAPSLGNQPTPV